MSIALSIFGFDANEYKQRAIMLHSTIHNIQSPIWWDNKGNLQQFAIT